ncbi:hypothetical protein E2C01_083314 [Portunus trituberculatus]|uniref:Uncharacterized protein n=1 Tax=Portunus trituberculatus TaxID=210409 RepID=A0A5B7IWV8_PORTR|nr:hypothetical protein [Portunus trituberculatus]
MKLPTRQPVYVATATINNILQKLHKMMMVAHSRPPNPTGDHGHLKNNNRDETILRPSASPPNKRDKRKNMGNTAKPATLSPGTTNHCSTPSRPNQQQTSYSKRRAQLPDRDC